MPIHLPIHLELAGQPPLLKPHSTQEKCLISCLTCLTSHSPHVSHLTHLMSHISHQTSHVSYVISNLIPPKRKQDHTPLPLYTQTLATLIFTLKQSKTQQGEQGQRDTWRADDECAAIVMSSTTCAIDNKSRTSQVQVSSSTSHL